MVLVLLLAAVVVAGVATLVYAQTRPQCTSNYEANRQGYAYCVSGTPSNTSPGAR